MKYSTKWNWKQFDMSLYNKAELRKSTWHCVQGCTKTFSTFCKWILGWKSWLTPHYPGNSCFLPLLEHLRINYYYIIIIIIIKSHHASRCIRPQLKNYMAGCQILHGWFSQTFFFCGPLILQFKLRELSPVKIRTW